MKYCPQCNRTVQDDAIFCTYCGTPLAESEPETHTPGGNPENKYHGHTSLTLGILSLVCSCIGGTVLIGAVLAVMGIVFAVKSRKTDGKMGGEAIGGMVLSIISLVIFALLIIFAAILILVFTNMTFAGGDKAAETDTFVQWIVQKAILFPR